MIKSPRHLCASVLLLAAVAFTPIAAIAAPGDPTVGEWATFGNGPSHSGYYPATLGSGAVTPGWSKSFPTAINQVAVSGDRVFLTTTGYFSGTMYAAALDKSNGTEIWRYPLASAYSINPPTVNNGRLFFQRCNNYSDTFLYALSTANGGLLWAAPHASQWERYMAPAVYNDGVWVNGGSYGGLYGFEIADGIQRFFNALPQEDEWTPSYHNGTLYTCVSGVFKAHDPRTGSDLWTRDLKSPGTSWYQGSVPAILNGKASVIASQSQTLATIDLNTRTKIWSVTGNFVGTPATDGATVYAILGSTVNAYDATSGSLLGSYTGGAGLFWQPLVTNDLVIVSNTTSTYIFDKATRVLRTTLPSGGYLSYTQGVLYVANANGTLATYVFQDAPAEPSPTPTPTPTPTPSATPTPSPSATPTPTATPSPTASASPGNPTPTPSPNPSQPAWIDAATSQNIAYFAFGGTAPRLERFDLLTETWLSPITLTAAPTAFAVDNSGIYVSLARSTFRISLDGATTSHLFNTATNVIGIVIGGDILYLNAGNGNFSSANKNTGALIAAKNFFYSITGLSIDTTHNKIFGRSSGISPSDIVQIGFTPAGDLGTQSDSPAHGDYPSAQRTFVSPDRSKVIDDAGIIYSTTDLTYLNSLNGAFTDLAFSTSTPVVLRMGALVAYSNAFLETGRFQLPGDPLRIFTSGDSVFAFYRGDTRGVWATKVALGLLNPQAPGEPVNPNGLNYVPDSVQLDDDGIIYLLSRANSSVFRWSVAEQRYLETIPLTDAPKYMAHSSTNNALYLAYSSGKITVIHLDQGMAEAPFANLPQTPVGLSTAGEFVFAADPSGAWASHYTFSPAGQLISSKEWNYVSSEYIWSQENRKMYFFRDDTSPNDLIWENIDLEGKLGTQQDTPYHTSDGIKHPIRIAPGGSYVLLGSGRLFHPVTLALINSLANDINDAAWVNTALFTLRGLTDSSEIQAWSNTYAITKSAPLIGTPLRLFSAGQSLIAITSAAGRPVFTILDAQLNTVSQSEVPPAPLGNISTRMNVGTGENVLIAGLIITGTEQKKVIFRGIGPSLQQQGISGALQNPQLRLFDQSGSLIASNNNWTDTQASEIQQTGIPPSDYRESAIVRTLNPGIYTCVLQGEGATTGIGVIEAYDLNMSANVTLANISSRGFVGQGDDVMIGGLIVAGGTGRTTTVLLRGIGPSLSNFNITGALQNPALELRNQSGTLVAENGDWKTTQQTAIEATGAPPTDDREAALIETLSAGNYTAILRGTDNTTGVGVVEIYNLQ